MAIEQAELEISPFTTHLHLVGQLEPRPGEEYLFDDQLASLELLTAERHNPQTPTLEIVECNGTKSQVTVANMLMRAYTRFGKFEVATADMRRFMDEQPGSHGLYLAHTTGLVTDGRQKFDAREAERPPQLRYTSGEFHGLRKDSLDVDVLFATIQSLRSRNGAHLPPSDHFGYMIVDESHHSKAPTHEDLIRSYFRPRIRLGITATPNRLDQLDIREIYGQEVVDIPLAEGIVKGRLRRVQYNVMLDQNARNLVESGRATTRELNRATRQIDPNLKEMIQRGDEEISRVGIESPKVLHFAQNIQQAEDIMACKPGAVVIHSGQSPELNDLALDAFNRGEVTDIISVNMLNEGRDLKGINVISFYRSTDSENIFLQQLGRGLQPAEDGSPLLVLDYVANAKRLQFLYNLMHGITDYALEATEYRRRLQPEIARAKGTERDIEIAREFGVDFELDDELLKVMESISDQQDFLDKKHEFSEIDEFEAVAYLVKCTEHGMKLTRTSFETMAKRGQGPSVRAMMAATGRTFEEMKALVEKSRPPVSAYHRMNNPKPADLLVYAIRDIVLRHTNSVSELDIPGEGMVYPGMHLDLTQEYGIKLSIDLANGMLFIDYPDQNREIGIYFDTKGKFEKYNKQWIIDDHIPNNKSLEFEGPLGLGDEKSPKKNQDRVNELFEAILTVRHALEASGQLKDDYPFYVLERPADIQPFLDRFSGEDIVREWGWYTEARQRQKRLAAELNQLKQIVRISQAETGNPSHTRTGLQSDTLYFPIFADEFSFDPDTEEVVFIGSDGRGEHRTVIDLKNRQASFFSSITDGRDHSAPITWGNIEEHFKGLVYSRFHEREHNPAALTPNQQAMAQQKARTFTQGWMERFLDKVNTARGYISDDQLAEFDEFADEVIGAYVEWPVRGSRSPDGKIRYKKGIIESVKYEYGRINVRWENDDIDSVYLGSIAQWNSKLGRYDKKPIMANLRIHPVE